MARTGRTQKRSVRPPAPRSRMSRSGLILRHPQETHDEATRNDDDWCHGAAGRHFCRHAVHAAGRPAALFRRQPRSACRSTRPPTAPSTRCRRTSRCTAPSIRPRAAPTTRRAASSSCRTAASAQNVQTNNAWISFINHDGSVHTARWIGIQNAGDQRSNLTPPLVLNEPLGSDIANGILYLADRDGGTSPTDPVVSVIRRFNLQTGAPAGEMRVEKSTGFNDIEVADDGTIYATQTGAAARRRTRRPGRSGRSRRTAPRRSSCRARRCGSRTASPSIRRATSSSSTSATTTC